MSSDSHPIIDLTSDSDDSSSSHTVVVSPVVSPPVSPLIMSDAETEPFEEEEVAPIPPVVSSPIPSMILHDVETEEVTSTPPVAPTIPAPVVPSPPVSPPHSATVFFGPNPSSPREIARMRVHALTITPVTASISQLPTYSKHNKINI